MLGARQSWQVGEAFLSAPFEESRWEEALRDLARHTRSSHGELIGIDSANSIALNWAPDLPPEFFSEFIEIDGGDPSRNWRVACVAPPLRIMSEVNYAEVRQEHPGQYDIYDDFAHRHGLVHGCQTVLLNEGGSFFGLAALRTLQDGPTSEEDRQAFAEVAPYVLNAVRLQRALEHQGASMVAGALEQMKAAAIVCDGSGRVRAITAAAEERLRSSSGLIVCDQRILAARADEGRLLGEGMARALNGAERGRVACFWLRGEAGHLDSEICEIFALPRREWSLGFEPRVLIILRWPRDVAGENRQLIQELWDLSSAEAAVALLLAQGLSRDDIAKTRATSRATVHTQLKSLFLKTGVSRESELVAMLGKVARLFGS